MTREMGRGAPAPEGGVVRVGTWNISHWTAAKVALISTMVQADILAVQETHLAPLPLEWRTRRSARRGYICITGGQLSRWPTRSTAAHAAWVFWAAKASH